MNIEYTEERLFPQLGFVGHVDGATGHLIHGPRVEVNESFFTDGAWAGDYESGPANDAFMVGSTGRLEGDELTLLTSQAPIDRMFIHEDATREKVVFSNSLPLILNALDDELDPCETHYRSFFMAVELGVGTASRHFTTRRGRTIRLVTNEIAKIRDRSVSYEMRPPHPPFERFGDYRKLSRCSQLLMENSADPARRNVFAPVASLSSGYDSSVVAVIMAEAGFPRALTMLRYADESERTLRDHPGTITKALGIELQEVRRDTWRERTDLLEATIAASCTTFMDVVMLAYDDLLEGKLLAVGHSGDSIWSTTNFRVYDDIVQGIGAVSGRGLAEHRLHRGYVMFPVPFIGMSAHRSIFKITNSQDICPWRIGGDYDRPIARRIVEEAGIPRDGFAVTKYAGSARVGSSVQRYTGTTREERTRELSEVMSPAAVTSFLDFVNSTCAEMTSSRRNTTERTMRMDRALHSLAAKTDSLNFRVGRAMHKHGIRGLVPRVAMQRIAERSKVYPDYTYLLPHWGIEVMNERLR